MPFKYDGILKNPRRYDPPPDDPKERHAWMQRKKEESLARWRALYEAHGVAYGDEGELLRRLAETHVNGFKEQARAGPKVRWDDATTFKLRYEVDREVEARNKHRPRKDSSITAVCKMLVKQEPWASLLRAKVDKGGALRAQYNRADGQMVDFVIGIQDAARRAVADPDYPLVATSKHRARLGRPHKEAHPPANPPKPDVE